VDAIALALAVAPSTDGNGMNVRIVALCGVRGAGKDAIAEVLCRRAGYVNVKFAQPMKAIVRHLFDLSEEHVEGGLKDTVHPGLGVSPRVLMQWFGTDVMQHGLAAVAPQVGRTFWSHKMRDLLHRVLHPHEPESQGSEPPRGIVISDMRFQHELDMLREHFGDRLTAVLVLRPSLAPADAHESECNVHRVGPVDLTLVNDGSMAALQQSAFDRLVAGRGGMSEMA
jgi:hypothetical protein